MYYLVVVIMSQLFPNYIYNPNITEYQFNVSLTSKWIQRFIMRDGPLIQPKQFYGFENDNNLKQYLENEFNYSFLDDSLDSIYTNDKYIASVYEIVNERLSKCLNRFYTWHSEGLYRIRVVLLSWFDEF